MSGPANTKSMVGRLIEFFYMQVILLHAFPKQCAISVGQTASAVPKQFTLVNTGVFRGKKY